MERNVKVILVAIGMVVLVAAVWSVLFKNNMNIVNNNGNGQDNQNQNQNQNGNAAVSNFDECMAAGYTVFESYPRKCVTSDGKIYTEDVGNEIELSDLIRLTSPRPNDSVENPLKITGEARGLWYYEAEFPIKLYDASGKEIGSAIAQAKTDWMTEDFVPFEATITFNSPGSGKGKLVLQKNNPSGLPQNDNSLSVPVNFGKGINTQAVSLYFYNWNSDKDANGNILCSKQGLSPVKRIINKTASPIEETVKLLFLGRISQEEKNAGLSTNFPLDGVELKGATVNNGVLTLAISDPKNKTSGGSCRVNVMRAQIEETVKQFPEVKSVKFLPEDLFQP